MLTGIFAALALGSLAHAAGAETLNVGAYSANPPWEFKNEESQFEGFEVDLVNAIGAKLGMDVIFQDLGFQALFAAVTSGRVDIAISTITITDERLKNQDFTQGYFDSDLALISTSDGVKSLDEVNGKPLGVLSSSVAEGWAKERADEYNFNPIRGYTDQQSLLLDVRAGRVAGAVGDLAGYQYALQQMPDLAILDRIPTGDRFGIMLPKGSDKTEAINAAISALKEDGTLAKIHEQWLGVAPDERTSTVTVLEIPKVKSLSN